MRTKKHALGVREVHLPDGHEVITVQIMLTHSERRVNNHQKIFVFYLPAADIFTRKILKNEHRAFVKCDVYRLTKYCIIVM